MHIMVWYTKNVRVHTILEIIRSHSYPTIYYTDLIKLVMKYDKEKKLPRNVGVMD